MHYLCSNRRILFIIMIILSFSACSDRPMGQPNPLGSQLLQETTSFTIQDRLFTYEKDVIINPKKIKELTQILHRAKWRPAQTEAEGAESLCLQLDSDDSLLKFSVREDGSALCVNSSGQRYTIDAKSYNKLHELMMWAKGEVVKEGEQLDQIWEEYLNNTYYTFGNGGNWSCPEDLPAAYFAKYALYQYLSKEYIKNGHAIPTAPNQSGIWCDMGSQNGESDQLYITRTATSEYAVKYLNFSAEYDPLAYDTPPQWAYTSELDAFFIANGNIKSMAWRNFTPRSALSDYGSGLEQVRIRDDGSISAVYAYYDLLDGKRITDSVMVYRMQSRPSSNPLYDEYPYYFTGVERIFVDNGRISVTVGESVEQRVLNSQGVFPEKLSPPQLRLLAENQDTLAFVDDSHDEGALFTLHLLDKGSLSLIKTVSLPNEKNDGDYSIFGVERRGERIYVRLRDRIISYSLTLDDQKEIELPAALLALKDSSESFDAEDIQITHYSGYDFSEDFSLFAYADIEGLKLLDVTNGTVTLLDGVIPQHTPMGLGKRVHATPRFVDNDKKILTTYSGYESNAGWLLYDLTEKRSLSIKGDTHGSVSEAGNNGLIFIDCNDEIQTAGFTRFSDGVTLKLPLQNQFDLTDIPLGGWYAINDKYAAFIVSLPSTTDEKNQSEYWINQVNLETLETKEKLLSIKGAMQVQIWGVLEDGTVLYNYYYSPAEKGTGFVK